MGVICSSATSTGAADAEIRHGPATGSTDSNMSLKLSTSTGLKPPKTGRCPCRSSSSPSFARSKTDSALKSGWRSKRNLRTTASEEITTVGDSRISRANYNFVRERLLKWTPSSYHCRLFCGGPACKYCDPSLFPTDLQAVPGLFSAWVTDDILATSRPTASAIKRFDIFGQLKSQNVVSVINLQRPYEHMHCGPSFPPKLEFAYDPEEFMKNDFFHYNFGWPDFGASSVACLFDMVKVLEFAVTQGKVAIHCHAGLGRTGLLICAFLMWHENYTSFDAIQLVRNKRPGSVQTTAQVALLIEFDDLLNSIRPIFDSKLTFQQHLNRQNQVLHGMEARLLRYIPKIVFVCCERLLELAGTSQNSALVDRLRLMHLCEDYDQFISNNISGHHFIQSPYVRRLSASITTEKENRRRSYSNASTMALGLQSRNAGKRSLVRFCTEEPQSTNRNQLPVLLPPIISDRSAIIVKQFEDNASDASDLSHVGVGGPKDLNATVGAPDSEKWRCVFDAVLNAGDSSVSDEVEKLKETLIETGFPSRWDALATEASCENVLLVLRDWFRSLKEVKWTLLYCAGVFRKISGKDSELESRFARYLMECFTKETNRNKYIESWFSASMECVAAEGTNML